MDDLNAIHRRVLGGEMPPATSALSHGGRAFVFPVWARPGLCMADRRLVTLTCVGLIGEAMPIAAHLYGALETGDLSLEELQEFILHFAVYCAWPRANALDTALRAQWERVRSAHGEEITEWPVLGTLAHHDEDEHLARAGEVFAEIMCMPTPTPTGPYPTVGGVGFAFGHVWQRPGLSRRQRRVVSITACAAGGWTSPLRMHLRAALLSRDLSREELGELVLQLAPYAGFPAAAGLQGQLDEVVEALKTASETPPPPS